MNIRVWISLIWQTKMKIINENKMKIVQLFILIKVDNIELNQ